MGKLRTAMAWKTITCFAVGYYYSQRALGGILAYIYHPPLAQKKTCGVPCGETTNQHLK